MQVASGGAYVGPWRMNDSRFHYVDDPTVNMAGDGALGVAWVDNRSRDVFFRRVEPQARAELGDPVDVSKSPQVFSWLPQMAIGEAGRRVFVLWQEIVFSGGSHGGEAFFARSRDGGRTFSEPKNLSRSEAGDGKGRLTEEIWHNGSLDLARAEDGTLYAAWTTYEGALWFRRSTDAGAHFEPAMRVAGTYEAPARAPDLGVGPDGAVVLAWTVGQNEAADIHLARSDGGGASFGEPQRVLEGDAHADAPKIEVDDEGWIHLAYGASDAGMFGPHHVRYARLSAEGRVVREAVRLDEPHATGGEAAHYPALELAGDGRVLVVWERYADADARPRGLGFALSRDHGGTFSAPVLVPGSADPELGFNGGLQGLLMDKLAADATGAFALVHGRFDPGEASVIRLRRGHVTKP